MYHSEHWNEAMDHSGIVTIEGEPLSSPLLGNYPEDKFDHLLLSDLLKDPSQESSHTLEDQASLPSIIINYAPSTDSDSDDDSYGSMPALIPRTYEDDTSDDDDSDHYISTNDSSD